MLQALIDELEQAERIGRGVLAASGEAGAMVSFDRGHLRQVLWNLCRNALRHGSGLSGSVRLVVGAEQGRVVLDVLDDGPGIPVEQQGKLFEPFFTTASDGTGLGLYIARELCEANGALLEYRADERQAGACFRITFASPDMDGQEFGHGQ
jgi:two-component system sensor histidine kinase PilS (NtrC family)